MCIYIKYVKYPLDALFIKVLPNPTNVLNNYPAKHPVIAIIAQPILANAGFANASDNEFPHAKNVRPIKVFGKPVSNPTNFK